MPILAQDLELVARCKGGDPSAFDELVRKYQDRLFNALVHFLGDAPAAEDLAQEAFLKAYLRIQDFRGDSQFYTWLYAIARNLSLSRQRQVARRGRMASLDSDDAPQVESGQGDPVGSMMSRDRENLVQEALQALDEGSRWLVVLRDVDGRDYEEIAETAGIPVGTVKSRLHRARMQLRQLLDGRV